MTFFEGAPSLDGVAAHAAAWTSGPGIGVEHLMASTAIPFIFPAVRIDDDYYVDGSMRQIAPLSPALHLGARRILVIAVGQFTGGQGALARHVGPARTRRSRRSRATRCRASSSTTWAPTSSACRRSISCVDADSGGVAARASCDIAHVDALVLAPARDIGAMALPHADRLPTGVRYLLRGLGGDTRHRREPSFVPAVRPRLSAASCSRSVTPTRWHVATRSSRSSSGDQAQFLPLFPADLLY